MAALLLALTAVPSAAADLHQLWDRQCGGCHGHAAQFARETLAVVDGHLRDRRSGREVEVFLQSHNGGYSPDIIAAMADMLKAQSGTPELFKTRCGGCHETAAQLVREQLVEQDGQLVGIVSRRPLAEYLPDHADLSEDDVSLLLGVLWRIHGEVRRRP
ncbi:MAG: hypothetical protein ACM31D_13230 [Bacteroidota bacterium]